VTTPFGGFTQIAVGPQPVQVCPPLGQGMSVTIYNQDINNVVTLGTTNNIAQDGTNGVPLQPLTPGTFPATKALYAIAPANTASLVVIPEGGTLSPSPAQIAAQIAATGLATFAEQVNQNTSIPANISTTGAPLLNLYNKIVSSVNTAIPANNSVSLPSAGNSYPITQIGYEFVIEAETFQNTAAAPLSVVFTWTDSATGFITGTQTYQFYAAYNSGSGGAHLIEAHGPSNGDQLEVQIFNGASAITVAYTLLQTSRLYGKHTWRTQNLTAGATFPTMTFISCAPVDNILAGQTSPSLNNSSITYLLPLFTGSAQFWGSIGVAANAGSFLLQDALSTLSNSTLARWKTSGGDVAPTTLVLPRDQCQLQMSNGTATASAMSAGMIAQELETN
jgi:hypothetical protein